MVTTSKSMHRSPNMMSITDNQSDLSHRLNCGQTAEAVRNTLTDAEKRLAWCALKG